MAEYRLMISGVHYGANGDQVAGQPDTEEMCDEITGNVKSRVPCGTRDSTVYNNYDLLYSGYYSSTGASSSATSSSTGAASTTGAAFRASSAALAALSSSAFSATTFTGISTVTSLWK